MPLLTSPSNRAESPSPLKLRASNDRDDSVLPMLRRYLIRPPSSRYIYLISDTFPQTLLAEIRVFRLRARTGNANPLDRGYDEGVPAMP
jgi:hypothetical protein